MSFEEASQLRCFRDKQWSNSSPKCVGGLDPTIIDTQTGGRRYQPKCRFHDICRDNTMRVQAAHRYPPQVPHHAPLPHLAPHQGGPPMMMNPWDAYFGPPTVPVRQYTQGTEIPSVLAYPEPIRPDVSPLSRFIIEVSRAVLSSACQQTCHIVKHQPWTKPLPPGDEER